MDSEIALQFEMRPVIQRVPCRKGNRSSPLFKFRIIGLVTGAEAFVHAVGAHGAPFIMITIKPYLGQVVEIDIIGNLVGRQVIVIVDYRHRRRMLVVQVAGCICL